MDLDAKIDEPRRVPEELPEVASCQLQTLVLVAVNNQGGFERWRYLEVTDPWEGAAAIRAAVHQVGNARSMKIRKGLEVNEGRLAEVCRRFHITELALFGSVLGDYFDQDSDVDVLYVGDPHLSGEPWAIVAFGQALEDVFGRRVDVVAKESVHWYIRDRVLAEAWLIYAA